MSKDDKTPPDNSADSKDPKDLQNIGGDSTDGKDAAATSSSAGKKSDEKVGTKSEKMSDKPSDKTSDKKLKDGTSTDSSDDTDVADDTDDEDSGKPGRGAGKKKGRGVPKWVAVASVVILVIGVAAAAWQAVGYFQDRSDKNAASLRDEVIDVASQVVVNSLSLSADTIDEDQERLRADSTGEFLRQQDEYAAEIKKTVTDQGATTSAQISNAALSDINDEAGTATVLLVYTAQSERAELPPVSGRQAARVELVREDDEWKVADMVPIGAQVPVGESSESVQQLGGAAGDGGAAADPESDSDSGDDAKAGAGATSSANSGTGSSERSGEKTRESDASPTSGAAATTAGGN